jgi:hypothetical protein
MPKSLSQVETVQISARVPLKTASYIKERAKDVGTVADVLREAVEAVHSFYGLPDRMAETLRADARRHHKDDINYVRDLLTKRFEELISEQVKK